ncbi:MAG: hypothetical protein ACRDZW_10275 [Acidimicrobiales bacterium]
MFKRLFWMAVGVGLGFGASFWVMRTLRQQVARYSPDRVASDLSGALRAFGQDLRAAAGEGAEAMRERERELRAEVGGVANVSPGNGWSRR